MNNDKPMNNDRQITLSTVKSRFDEKCTIQTMLVSEFYNKLSTPIKIQETREQFLKLSKAARDRSKDVGGFIGGKMFNGIRKAGYVEYRDVVSLDMDSIPTGQTETVINRLYQLGVTFCAYSTRNHSPEAPRLRVVFPLDRAVTADEYEPISRKIAYIIQPEMTWFDRTTFDVSRIMYWPSICSDSQYVYHWADKLFASADGLLELYSDWRNFNEWPRCPSEDLNHAPNTRQADPLEKKGAVGAFCKIYTIQSAIAKFLPDIYISAGENRYTYAKGSTTGGAVVYDNKFLYSHHATDPACGTLCNAFDLVRIHLFGKEDETAKADTPTNRLPSFLQMQAFALADEDVNMQIRIERAASVYEDFADISIGESSNGSSPEENLKELTAWLKLLKVDGNGVYVKSIENVMIALENDPQLKGRIYMNTFTQRPIAVAPLPWGLHKSVKINTTFEWTDADDSGLLVYLEKLIGLRTKSTMANALEEYRAAHPFHPVQSYLSGLSWDGILRIETLFQTYLGAQDTAYVRAAAKMTLVAAVTRVFHPGTKFDTAIVFVGEQGIGKSTFISTLAKFPDWYTDDIKAFDKTAIENIQGIWIVELAELSAMKHSDLETTKSFISRTIDRTRLAYAKNAVALRRSCIFFGTSNPKEFLKDDTGERRFYPIDVGVVSTQKSIFLDLPSEVDQVWAEAMYYYHEGKTPLVLPKEVIPIAVEAQKAHKVGVEDPIIGVIETFLERPIPQDWDSYTLDQRILYLADTATERTNLVPRKTVCAFEIWCECFGEKKERATTRELKKINRMLRTLGWEKGEQQTMKMPLYGRQKYYEKH